MFILLTIGLFIAKFLALGVVGLFFLEDLTLTQDATGGAYGAYLAVGCVTFFALFFFLLGKKLLWLVIFILCGTMYLTMYNTAPGIAEIHQKHDIKSRYFKDTETFTARMLDVYDYFTKEEKVSKK